MIARVRQTKLNSMMRATARASLDAMVIFDGRVEGYYSDGDFVMALWTGVDYGGYVGRGVLAVWLKDDSRC